MITNLNFKNFKKSCLRRSHQTLFKSLNCNNYKKIENIFQFLLSEKDSFIFESVEKVKIKGRFTKEFLKSELPIKRELFAKTRLSL